jgi:hypothetical protein
MNSRHLIPFLVLFTTATFAAVPLELRDAQAIYLEQLTELYSPFSNRRVILKHQYAQAQRQLMQKAQAAGNLNAASAAKKEFERFANYRNFDENSRPRSTPEVQALFDRYAQFEAQLLAEFTSVRNRLDHAYAQKLAEIQKLLTVANRIDDAVHIKDAIAGIKNLRVPGRTHPGLLQGAKPLNYTLPAEVKARLLRTRWELIWSGGRSVPDTKEYLEFHYGDIVRYQTADGKSHKYSYTINDDLSIEIGTRRSKTVTFDPSFSLMDFNDDHYKSYRRGRLIGKIEDSGSANMLQDILLYYPLDEVTASAKDSGPNGNFAAGQNTAVVHFGKRKNAWQFNGVNANLTVNLPIELDDMEQFSVACWFNIKAYVRRSKLFHWEGDGEYGGVYVSLDDRSISYRIGSGQSDTRYVIERTFDLKTWYHVVLTYDAHGGALLYLDGNLIHAVPSPTLVNNDTTLYIAGNAGKDNNSATFFNGWLDEFFVFKRALKPDEVKTLYEFGDK